MKMVKAYFGLIGTNLVVVSAKSHGQVVLAESNTAEIAPDRTGRGIWCVSASVLCDDGYLHKTVIATFDSEGEAEGLIDMIGMAERSSRKTYGGGPPTQPPGRHDRKFA